MTSLTIPTSSSYEMSSHSSPTLWRTATSFACFFAASVTRSASVFEPVAAALAVVAV